MLYEKHSSKNTALRALNTYPAIRIETASKVRISSNIPHMDPTVTHKSQLTTTFQKLLIHSDESELCSITAPAAGLQEDTSLLLCLQILYSS